MAIKLSILVMSALVLLTGCGESENQSSPVTVPTALSSTQVPSFEGKPIIDVPVDGVITGTRGESDISKLPTTEILELNPEKVKPVNPKAEFPDNFLIPSAYDYIKGASKLDGNQSHVVIGFDKNWQEAANDLRAEMESQGWVCFECLPFVAVGANADNFKASKYLLNMYNDSTKVMVIISETSKGFAIASMNFSAK